MTKYLFAIALAFTGCTDFSSSNQDPTNTPTSDADKSDSHEGGVHSLGCACTDGLPYDILTGRTYFACMQYLTNVYGFTSVAWREVNADGSWGYYVAADDSGLPPNTVPCTKVTYL